MGKRIEKSLILAIVLLYQLSFVNFASAGFYDWLTDKDTSASILAQASENSRLASDNFYQWAKSVEEDEQEAPKIAYRVTAEAMRQVTAYNVGDPYQTDSTPCTGAYSKVNLCDELEKGVRICAANFVRLGTILRIGEGEESFECIVWDRMHSRFSARVDIAMSLSEKKEARQHGKQTLKVQILEEIDDELATAI